MMVLLGAMAGCEGLFPIEKCSENSESNSEVGGKEAVMRLQYAIRRLLKVICTNLKGVVLFIDDLQWSDTATLDLIRSIALDTEIPSLLLVGAYREDEVPDSHPLAIHIRELGEQRDIVITTINVKNLSPSNVTSLVADALRMEDNESAVETLAKSVHKKTDGNAFFVLLFLRYLYDDGLIQFNFGAMKWLWDDDVVSSTMVMQNVATIMVNRLKQFQERSQTILKVASCLGASFSKSVVAMVVETLSETQSWKISDHDEIASLITSSIDEFEKDGIWEVESESESIWRFSHDQIQSASLELIPSEERDSFRGKVGNALMTRLDTDLLEQFLFEAVTLQNYAMPSMSSDERKALAKMNLRAGLKASKNASFETAVVYFMSGRELLERSWEVDPDTMLQLCSEEANARFIANDNLETMNLLINEVIDQPIPVRDKSRVYEVKVNSALARGDLRESLDTGLGFCRKLGLPVPKNKPVSKFTILKEYFKTKRAVGNRTVDEIASLPELSDELIIMGRKMLNLAIPACYLSQPTLFPIIVLLTVRSCVKYGISASSSDGFAAFGVLLCGAFGKLKEGEDMAKATDLILAKHNWKVMKSRVIFICENFILHWTAPLPASFDSLLEGYQIGLCTGDIDSAGWCLAIRCHHLFFAARPLEGLQREIQACIDILSQMNLEAHRMIVLPYFLAVAKLRGVDVAEECMDFEDMLKVASETNNLSNRGHTFFAQLELMVIFKEWKRATMLLVEADNLRVTIPACFVGVRFTALEALISFKAAQSSPFLGKMKWKRRGVKSMKLLRSWVKKGNGNAVHLLYIVSAQLAVLEGKWKKAEDGFKSAAKVAARNGLLQDKALAHELARAHFTAQGDTFWANHHKESSQQAYSDWGAKSKVVEEIE